MLRTRAGYCGGTTPAPTYRSIGDHTEAISVDYDPENTSYDALLDAFWSAHNCRAGGRSSQYRTAVFSRNDAQREAAERSRSGRAQALGIPDSEVQTPVVPIDRFTLAEHYHHKYRLRSGGPLRRFLEETYPGTKAFADSSVAMRLNSITGSKDPAAWKTVLAELPHYGLPPGLASRLRHQR